MYPGIKRAVPHTWTRPGFIRRIVGVSKEKCAPHSMDAGCWSYPRLPSLFADLFAHPTLASDHFPDHAALRESLTPTATRLTFHSSSRI